MSSKQESESQSITPEEVLADTKRRLRMFPVELEEKIPTLEKPLIIESACPGWQSRMWGPKELYHQLPPGYEEGGVRYPAIPISIEDQANEDIEAVKAGAVVIHHHPRDPETGISVSAKPMDVPLLSKIYDRVLDEVDAVTLQHTWLKDPETGQIDFILMRPHPVALFDTHPHDVGTQHDGQDGHGKPVAPSGIDSHNTFWECFSNHVQVGNELKGSPGIMVNRVSMMFSHMHIQNIGFPGGDACVHQKVLQAECRISVKELINRLDPMLFEKHSHNTFWECFSNHVQVGNELKGSPGIMVNRVSMMFSHMHIQNIGFPGGDACVHQKVLQAECRISVKELINRLDPMLFEPLHSRLGGLDTLENVPLFIGAAEQHYGTLTVFVPWPTLPLSRLGGRLCGWLRRPLWFPSFLFTIRNSC